jgi:hypothetical protein
MYLQPRHKSRLGATGSATQSQWRPRGIIPLVLRGLGQDPALASGPILTTITDMSGFFLVLTLAGAALPWLTS